jgi:hypothetical protein
MAVDLHNFLTLHMLGSHSAPNTSLQCWMQSLYSQYLILELQNLSGLCCPLDPNELLLQTQELPPHTFLGLG